MKTETTEFCVICKQQTDNEQNVVKISQKAAHGVNEASQSRESDVVATAGIRVHTSCRKSFLI